MILQFKKRADYCVVFICQYGELEVRSLLLAASLRKYLIGNYELVAAIPSPAKVWGKVTQDTLSILEKLGVRIEFIENPVSVNYPMLNKLGALGISTKAKNVVYLDCDILCINELNLNNVFTGEFTVKPADLQTYSMDIDLWEKLYGLVKLPLPKRKVLSTVDHVLMFPYFNSGVVHTNQPNALAKMWAKICRLILNDTSIPNTNFWVCQIGLPIAAAKIGVRFTCLHEKYNYPVNCKLIDQGSPPTLCHYKNIKKMRGEPILIAHVQEYIEQYPSLKNLIARHDEWRPILHRNRVAVKNPSTDFIITGIPRSGTSLLCHLLHKQPNIVVINEPKEIFPPLIKQFVPKGVAEYYSKIRLDILENREVENKVLDGEVVKDTLNNDHRNLYTPTIESDNFTLGTKNTITYLSRIKSLMRVFPNSPFIASVRHPFDTIASWKSSFDMLKMADVRKFPVGGPDDPFIDFDCRKRLAKIASCDDTIIKRALLWRHFASIIIENKNILHISRYEDLINDTKETLKQLLEVIDCHSKSPILEAEIKHINKRDLLSEHEQNVIWDLCFDIAGEFGYRRQ